MFRNVKEIESYEHKASKVMNILSESVNINIENLVKETELSRSEISEIVKALEKSQYIELSSHDHVHISKYGRKINNGEINVGYGPI